MKILEIIADAARGIYIPQFVAKNYDLSLFGFSPKEIHQYKRDLSDPSNEGYWESWNSLMNRAVYQKDCIDYYLHHDGDLFLVQYEEGDDN
jgi:hypothetical protein